MLAGPLYSAVERPVSVAAAASNRIGSNSVNSVIAELNRTAFNHTTPRSVVCYCRQPGEFRYCGTEPGCGQRHPPHGVWSAIADSQRESAPQHDGACIHDPWCSGSADCRGRRPWTSPRSGRGAGLTVVVKRSKQPSAGRSRERRRGMVEGCLSTSPHRGAWGVKYHPRIKRICEACLKRLHGKQLRRINRRNPWSGSSCGTIPFARLHPPFGGLGGRVQWSGFWRRAEWGTSEARRQKTLDCASP